MTSLKEIPASRFASLLASDSRLNIGFDDLRTYRALPFRDLGGGSIGPRPDIIELSQQTVPAWRHQAGGVMVDVTMDDGTEHRLTFGPLSRSVILMDRGVWIHRNYYTPGAIFPIDRIAKIETRT